MPKAAAHDRLTSANGSLCIRAAAKTLRMRPKDLTGWMMANGWAYRRPGGNLLGYQRHTENGDLEHRVTVIPRPDGPETIREQVRVTPQGLTKLAKLMPDRRPEPRADRVIACEAAPGRDPHSVFVSRVRARVNALNETPTALATRHGLGRDFIRDIITKNQRKRGVRYAGLIRLAAALDCDVEYLTLRQGTPRRQNGGGNAQYH